MQFIVNRKGKQLRPMFVLLSAKLCGPVNEAAYRAASLVELLHTATLVHDDVVDESLERRGFFSTYALWKTKISVLVGDYLLSKGLSLSLDHGDFRVLQILNQTPVRNMSRGRVAAVGKIQIAQPERSLYTLRSFVTRQPLSSLRPAPQALMLPARMRHKPSN